MKLRPILFGAVLALAGPALIACDDDGSGNGPGADGQTTDSIASDAGDTGGTGPDGQVDPDGSTVGPDGTNGGPDGTGPDGAGPDGAGPDGTTTPECGDGVCNGNETQITCPTDCGGGTDDPLFCFELLGCAFEACPGLTGQELQTCANNALNGECRDASTEDEFGFFLAKNQCESGCVSMDGGMQVVDWDCMRDECSDETAACQSGGETGEDTCAELLTCAQGCGGQTDSACIRDCYASASQTAQELDAETTYCLNDACGDSQTQQQFQSCAQQALLSDDGLCNALYTECEEGPQSECGDGTCDDDEDAESCPEDCEEATPECGDGECNGDEDAESCPEDCEDEGPVCGDGTCNGGEDAEGCPEDCTECGDGLCTGDETIETCAEDCTECGDGLCTGDETADTCAVDCGVCANAADRTDLEDTPLDEAGPVCAGECSEDDDVSACATSCLESGVGTSAGCSECLGDFLGCVVDACESVCLSEPDETECDNCVQASCQSDLEICGVEGPDEEEPAGAEPFSRIPQVPEEMFFLPVPRHAVPLP